jgi:hypothetical protein
MFLRGCSQARLYHDIPRRYTLHSCQLFTAIAGPNHETLYVKFSCPRAAFRAPEGADAVCAEAAFRRAPRSRFFGEIVWPTWVWAAVGFVWEHERKREPWKEESICLPIRWVLMLVVMVHISYSSIVHKHGGSAASPSYRHP